MESTNQDDDSTFESKDNAPNESSANVDFKCEDEDQKATPSGLAVEQLKIIAESGIVDVEWPTLQQALRDRLDEVIELYIEKNPDCKEDEYQEPNVGKFNLGNSKDEILEMIASFNEAPFTIQRICELLYSPFKYYDRTSTFLRGLEKNLRVISSNDWPKSPINGPLVSDFENDRTSNATTQLSSGQSSQLHEEMSQCEDQQPILEQPAPAEAQAEPTSSTSSMSPPPPQICSPLKEVT